MPPGGHGHRLKTLRLRPACGNLFDCHGKPPDQLGNLIQMVHVTPFDDARQPGHAFVVAQRDYVVRNDRWHGISTIRSNAAFHRFNLPESRHGSGFRPIESIWGPGSAAAAGWRGAPSDPRAAVSMTSKCPRNLLHYRGFPHRETIANRCAISPMQAEKALLYAARSRSFVSLIPR